MQPATTVLVGTTAVVMLLAGCAPDEAGTPAEASPASETPSSQAPTPDAPSRTAAQTDEPSPGRPAFARPSGPNDLTLTGVSVSEREQGDRIVLEFAGTGVPGWSVDVVDEPRLEGSNRLIRLDGDSYLTVFASGTITGGDSEPRRFAPEDGGDVSEVYVVGGSVEGATQVLVGLDDHPGRLRVFALTEPSRLVVDLLD